MNDLKIEKLRCSYPVCIANDFVRKARYSTNLLAQRLFIFICVLIRPNKPKRGPWSNNELTYEFDLKDFYRVFEVSHISTKAYSDAKKALKSLCNESLCIPDEKGEELNVSFLSQVIVASDSNHVTVELSSALIPYLFNLKRDYIFFAIDEITDMTSGYSIRLYELLRSYRYVQKVTFTVKHLKELLMLGGKDSYNRYSNFKQRILTKAISEINQYSFIFVDYEELKTGRYVTHIRFTIKGDEDEELPPPPWVYKHKNKHKSDIDLPF